MRYHGRLSIGCSCAGLGLAKPRPYHSSTCFATDSPCSCAGYVRELAERVRVSTAHLFFPSLQDESKIRRKQILSTIGEDLLLAANDQPFRFPAAFTFVVRSFTVLDGIGKVRGLRCQACRLRHWTWGPVSSV